MEENREVVIMMVEDEERESEMEIKEKVEGGEK